MENWITEFMEQYGYLGVFLMIALENVFPPIPSEIILPFGGFMTTYTSMTVPGVVIASTAGSVVGAMILYGIGLLLDVERLEKIIDRFGHILRVTKEDVHKADAWFDKYGIWTVLFCRMVPLIRSLDIDSCRYVKHEILAIYRLYNGRYINLEYHTCVCWGCFRG